MKTRILLFALLFTVAFVLYSSHRRPLMQVISAPSNYVQERLGKAEITEAAGSAPIDPAEQNNIEVYKRVMPSVVNITSTAVAYDFFYGPVPEQGLGTGFVLNKEGQILTNNHVIKDAREVQVTLWNRKTYKAAIVGTDPSHDLAIVQIKAPLLTPATLGDSHACRWARTCMPSAIRSA